MLEIEKENNRLLFVGNVLWQKLWTCRKTDYMTNEVRGSLLLNGFI